MFLKFLINLIPIKKLRHHLKWCVNTDFYDEYCYEEHIKFLALQHHKKTLKTVVLGSSHANYGFLPKKQEVNLGGGSQDLYLSCKIYEYLNRNDFHNIKNIILFYDVFSDGFDLAKTSIDYVCVPYKLLYGIPYRTILSKKAKIIEEKITKILHTKTVKIPNGYYGKALYRIWNENIDVSKRVESHLKNNHREIKQTQYLAEIIDKTKTNKQQLYIVTPPLRKDYRELLPDYNDIFSNLLHTIRNHKHVHLLNYQDDKDFIETDFGDCDHLNQRGAEKLSNKIRIYIHTMEK